MMPLRFHAPPDPARVCAGPKTVGGPPEISIFFRVRSALKPTYRLSGDQNKSSAFSVPARTWAVRMPIGRIQMALLPSDFAMYAIRRPFGEMARVDAAAPTVRKKPGAVISKRISVASEGARKK